MRQLRITNLFSALGKNLYIYIKGFNLIWMEEKSLKSAYAMNKYFTQLINFQRQTEFQVSWVRHRDIHLLTVGRYTYTSDQRFEAMHSPHTEEWTLRIRYAQRKDSGECFCCTNLRFHLLTCLHFNLFFRCSTKGIYECQISTTPPVGHFVYLTVVGEYHISGKKASL